jgi:hypothetical protein
MRDPVRGDTERYQAQLLVDEDVGPAHRQAAARSWLASGDGDLMYVMRGREADEVGWPAERAVDPGLVGRPHHPRDGLIVDAAGRLLDDSAPGTPLNYGDRGPLRLAARSTPAVITGQG